MADDPPPHAVWLLRHVARRNDALEGDLLEEFHRGRSEEWYWRQVLIAVALTRLTEALLFVAFATVYLVGHLVPLPGTNTPALALSATRARQVAGFRVFDLIAGGNFVIPTIFALGIYPFIVASIIVQGLAAVVRLGTKRTFAHVVTTTWVLAVVLASVWAYGLSVFLVRQSRFPDVAPLIFGPGATFEIAAVLLMVIGFVALMGLSEFVTSRGLGNGMLIAFLAALAAGALSTSSATPGVIASSSAMAYLVALSLIVAVTGNAHGRALRDPHTA